MDELENNASMTITLPHIGEGVTCWYNNMKSIVKSLLQAVSIGLMLIAFTIWYGKLADEAFVRRAVDAGYYCTMDAELRSPVDGYYCVDGVAIKK